MIMIKLKFFISFKKHALFYYLKLLFKINILVHIVKLKISYMFKLVSSLSKNVCLTNNILKRSINKTYKEINNKRMSFENSSHIVWVDLDMSGLNIEKDHILEMACLITDKNLNIVAEGPELVINQSDSVLDGMDDWCKRTHSKSGLTEAVKNSKITIEEAEQTMLEFLQKYVPTKTCPLAGNSVYMDRIFLNKYMNKFNDYLHYRIIDVSTIKELNFRWYECICLNNYIFRMKC